MKTGDFFTLMLFAVGIAVVVGIIIGKAIAGRKVQNARTQFYTNFAGLTPVFPYDPDDDQVEQRAADMRAEFHAHGNHFGPKVVAYWYGCNLDGKSTIAMQWGAFIAEACKDYLKQLEKHNTDKIKADPLAAAQHLGGQTFFTITPTPNNQYIK